MFKRKAASEKLASNDPVANDELQLSILGNVEGVENGFLTGWALNELDHVEKLAINIVEDDAVIAEGIANEFRPDLEAAGIGDGHSMFRVALPDALYDGLEHSLQVVEQRSNTVVGAVESRIPAFAASHVKSVHGGQLVGLIELDSPSDKKAFIVEIMVDGRVCMEAQSKSTDCATKHTLNVTLPNHLFDDNYHVYSLRLKGRGTLASPNYLRVNALQTRWEYIGSSFASMSISAMPKMAAYRYRALQEHIRYLVPGGPGLQLLADVQLAHDVVVEGFHNRKQFPKLTLQACEKPVVSVIIPVHNNFQLTYNCIASLILSYNKQSFEVIVVDDESTDQTTDIDDYVENVRVVKNESNLGFLLTAEAGASAAKGEYLFFLNNDTEVTSGWLDSLYEVFEKFDNVGMAGSKLIYPNGQLQEAGGVVWSNGQPSNVGNGGNAEDPVYNYVRPADYVSGAAMMIKRSVWDQVGGFSKEFVPAYYEDTDLAFKIREAGFKTYYAPASVIVHYEGMSNGRDLDSGYKRFQNVNAPQFRQKWRHAYRHHGKYGVNVEYEVDRSRDFRVLMVDYTTPKPDQDAGSYAAVQEMRLLQELGCKVTFVPNNMAHMGRYTTELQNNGIECLYAPFHRNVGEVLRDRGPEFDLVYITRYDVAEEILKYVAEYTKAKVVLNNADLHFLREMRAAQLGEGGDLPAALDTRQRELAVIESVDAVLSYNDLEHSIISSHTFESENIFKCPWVLNKKTRRNSFADRNAIAFLGSYNHLPNKEAVMYFVNEVMPLLREKDPEIQFHIYGSGVTEDIEALACDDIIIKGFVNTLDELFENCRLFVAPLLSGAGIKGKVLESVSYQVPVVLSSVAAESTGLAHDYNAKIAATPEEWVSAITELYHDEAEWMRLSENALKLVDERYSFDHGLKLMANMMSHLELDPAENREPYFQVR